MVTARHCTAVSAEGTACRAYPGVGSSVCFLHDPERAPEAAEVRRMGGLRRRREGTLAAAYDLQGLSSVEGIRRLLEIVVADALGLDNGAARLRILLSAAATAARLLALGDFEERLAALEAVTPRTAPPLDATAFGPYAGARA